MKKLWWILSGFLLLAALFLSACAVRHTTDADFAAGEELTQQEMDRLVDEWTELGLLSSDDAEADSEEDPVTVVSREESADSGTVSEEALDLDARVYWAEGGSVWHDDLYCPALDRAEKIYAGSVRAALGENKTRLCKLCTESGKSEHETVQRTPVETESDTEVPVSETVYWVDGGAVWHTKEDCTSLRNAALIRSGTAEEAAAAGKSRACSRCD